MLTRAGLSLADVDVVEINEAFASVVLAWARELEGGHGAGQPERRRHRAGPPARGHRRDLLTKLLNELERQDKQIGLQTMCVGFGQATATIIERE